MSWSVEEKVEEKGKKLVEDAMEGNWSEVLETFKKESRLRTFKRKETGDTVLHIAVYKKENIIVADMMELLVEEERAHLDNDVLVVKVTGDDDDVSGEQVLIRNDLKAVLGAKNNKGETPLFTAVLHDNREAFLRLHHLHTRIRHPSSTRRDYHYRNDDNDTILHCAISRKQIDFAIDIVLLHREDDLKEMVKPNKNGLSPLHLLAANPSAFQSTDLPRQSFVVQLIYRWFFEVKEKEQATAMKELEQERDHERETSAWLWVAVCTSCLAVGGIFSSNLVKIFCSLFCLLLGILFFIPVLALAIMRLLFVKTGNWFRRIRTMKKKHTWSRQLVKILVKHASLEDLSRITSRTATKDDNDVGYEIVDTPLMIAVKNGVEEIVKEILNPFHHTMGDANDEGKNIVLLAAEKRQTKVYQILCEYKYEFDLSNEFRKVDNDGNTALHLAAKSGANLNMQKTTMIEEFKWYEFVKSSVPDELWEKYNKDGKTAEEIFRGSYKERIASDRKWLDQTSQTCSVASTLVASMAFSNVVSDKFDEKNHSVLVALSLSLNSTISFLAILAFHSQSLRFWRYAPFMLQIAILTMFGSIVALWISLMFHAKSITTYAILGSPIAIFTILSLPIFIGPTLVSLFTKLPPPNRDTTGAIRYRRAPRNGKGTDFDRNQEHAPNPKFRANDSLQDIGNSTTRSRIRRTNSL